MGVKFAVSYLVFQYLSKHVWQFLGRLPLSLQSTVGTAPGTDPRPLPLCHFNTLFTCVLPPFYRVIPEVSVHGEVMQESSYNLLKHMLYMGTMGIRPGE
jgi:hypothetical protein